MDVCFSAVVNWHDRTNVCEFSTSDSFKAMWYTMLYSTSEIEVNIHTCHVQLHVHWRHFWCMCQADQTSGTVGMGLAERIVGWRFVRREHRPALRRVVLPSVQAAIWAKRRGFCHSCGVRVCVGAVGINSKAMIYEQSRSQCVRGSQCYFLACFRWGITQYDSR